MGQSQNRSLTAFDRCGYLTEPLKTESPVYFGYRHTGQTETLGVVAGVPLEGLATRRRVSEEDMRRPSARSRLRAATSRFCPVLAEAAPTARATAFWATTGT